MAAVDRGLIETEVRPKSPFSLPRMLGSERILVRHGSGLRRLIVLDGAAVIVSVRPGPQGTFRFEALGVDPDRVSGPGSEALVQAGEGQLELAIEDFRFSLGIDDDTAPFREAFAADPLLGPAIAARPTARSQRRPVPWEALAWAISEQLIEYRRAAAIQRRMIGRWGLSVEMDESPASSHRGRDRGRTGRRPGGRMPSRLSTAPSPGVIAGAAPAELQACDLSARRSIAMVRAAREVSRGRIDLRDPDGDRRLLAIPEIGPWTVAFLGLRGRGDPDALLAGDLGHIKLVGALAGLGRPAEVEEVERFYEPYTPYRGLAGDFLLAHRGALVHGPGNRARIRAAGRPARAA